MPGIARQKNHRTVMVFRQSKLIGIFEFLKLRFVFGGNPTGRLLLRCFKHDRIIKFVLDTVGHNFKL